MMMVMVAVLAAATQRNPGQEREHERASRVPNKGRSCRAGSWGL